MDADKAKQGDQASAQPRSLKAYCYDGGFCVSALSIEEARAYVKELLPWPRNEKDDALVREVEDSELDNRFHFYWDNEVDDEVHRTLRDELSFRMAHGETEPDTFYNKVCLIPTEPSYQGIDDAH